MQTHKATNIVLKEALVDDGIKEVVDWINSLDCITIGCCQGGGAKTICAAYPYVTFICWEQESLDHIVSVVKSFLKRYREDHKYMDPNPIKLEHRQSLTKHFALSSMLLLQMDRVNTLSAFIEHIGGLSDINQGGNMPEDTVDDLSIL